MSCFVYVIGREEGPVKVGISSNPYGRLSMIQTGCPFRVSVLSEFKFPSRDAARQMERHFHDVYENERLSGEWFDLEADLAIEGMETSIEFDRYFREEGRLA